MSLEQEFEQYKAIHKFAILKARLIQYYKDLEDGTVQIPDFMRVGQRPEDLADRDIRNLISRSNNLNEFNILYEQAYKDLAEVLD